MPLVSSGEYPFHLCKVSFHEYYKSTLAFSVKLLYWHYTGIAETNYRAAIHVVRLCHNDVDDANTTWCAEMYGTSLRNLR